VDNETSDTLLQISDVTSRLKRLQQGLDEQNAAVQQHNKLITRAEMEIVKNNALVERKQTQVDQLNKKIDFATSKLGGVSV
jgi:predicted  nucleic acid-binding Zn-ribbon protein